jgi:hypothetical protein
MAPAAAAKILRAVSAATVSALGRQLTGID